MTELVDVLVPDEVTHVRVLSAEEALRAELARALDDMTDAARQLDELGGAAGEVGRELRGRAQKIRLRTPGPR